MKVKGVVILVECSFNTGALSHCTVPSASLTKWKNSPLPPVDLSILLLRQLDQCLSNVHWVDVKVNVHSPSSTLHFVRDQMFWAGPGSQLSGAFV